MAALLPAARLMAMPMCALRWKRLSRHQSNSPGKSIPGLDCTERSTPFGDPNKFNPDDRRSEEHTSELQSLMRISYAVFCLKKKKHKNNNITNQIYTNNNIKE